MSQSSRMVEERLTCAFVLAAELYFRLAGSDPHGREARLGRFHATLHDTARDLLALTHCARRDVAGMHLRQGVAELRESLQDLVETVEPTDAERHRGLVAQIVRLDRALQADRPR
ncbi:MAG: hypothetical protein AAGG47_14420 [Pseudomonadota bacterium]